MSSDTTPEIGLTDCDEHGIDTLAADGECVMCLNESPDGPPDDPAIGVAIGIEQIDRGKTASKEDIDDALKFTNNDE